MQPRHSLSIRREGKATASSIIIRVVTILILRTGRFVRFTVLASSASQDRWVGWACRRKWKPGGRCATTAGASVLMPTATNCRAYVREPGGNASMNLWLQRYETLRDQQIATGLGAGFGVVVLAPSPQSGEEIRITSVLARFA